MNVDQIDARFCQNLRHVGQGPDFVGKIDEQVVKAGNCAKLFRAERIASDFGRFEEIEQGFLLLFFDFFLCKFLSKYFFKIQLVGLTQSLSVSLKCSHLFQLIQ